MAIQTFTSGQVLTAAQVNALQANDYNQTVSTKTANYVLVAADKGTRVEMNAAGATTITVNTSLFSAGDTLFIQNIGAGICTITAGTATVSTTGSLALAQNGGGTLYFTSAGVSIFFTGGGAASKILQVVSTTKTDTFSMSSTTFADVTGLTATITPSTITSKILVMYHSSVGNNLNNTVGWFRLTRAGTAIGIGDAAGSRIRATTPRVSGGTVNNTSIIAGNFLDSPATTSATTYALQIASETPGVSVYVNRGDTDTDSTAFARGISTITLMEVSA